ncbi:hypothetical protein [Rhizobium mayense]|uniref:Uncharacterized protein n=1 Tax=Rhizobium mayense TaxID=1312184 RepID=A0ABT7K4W3_9HYPH|nr:hypothetical protein [Rhizobium mayense]MDL2403656.1 hypothetical protein [Rhizobium mayense]
MQTKPGSQNIVRLVSRDGQIVGPVRELLTGEPDFERCAASFGTEKPVSKQNDTPLLAGVFVMIFLMFVAEGYMSVWALFGYRLQNFSYQEFKLDMAPGDRTHTNR